MCYIGSVVNSLDVQKVLFLLTEKRILVAIDEDGNAFEDKCFNIFVYDLNQR
jgi:hypothetical protein